MADLNRRQFVALTALTACACAMSGEALLAADAASSTFDAGPVTDYASDGIFDKFAKSNKLILVRKGSKIIALNATCTHKNCVVKPKDDALRCPCHGSGYGATGEVTKGPSKTPLTRYRVSITANSRVMVDLSQKIDAGSADGEVEVKA